MGSFFGTNIGVDLGTANTLISVDGKGIVLNEPSVIAKDTDRDVVLAVGQSAKDMLGKAPAHIRVVKPLEEGVISDFDMAADMLATFFKQMMGQRGKIKARVAIGVPSGVTEVEKRAVEEVVTNLGPKEVYILEEPMAAAIGAGMDVDGTTGCMIVDIGGGTTDIAVISLGGIVASESIKMAGDKFDDHIVRYMAKEHNLYIGERTAEELKMNIGTAYPREESVTMECRGRDRVTGLPKTVEITSEEMMNALKEPLDAIVEAVHIVLEQTPPELAADISTSGITITGGGALLYGIDKRIQESIGIEVKIAEDPKECVAKGTGESLEEIEKLENNAMNKRKAYI